MASSSPPTTVGPSLTIRTSTSHSDVNGLENLKVTTTVTNTGNETLKLLNDPRGVLDPFPEHSFTVTDSAGSCPSFIGAKVKYSPEYAATLDEPSVFTILAPGDSTDVTHDLSAAYDFTPSGPGQYSVEPSNLFTYVGANGAVNEIYATVEDPAEFKLSGNLVVETPAFRVDPTISFVQCAQAQQTQLRTAAVDAQTYARNAHTYISGISSGTTRYTTWFGAYVAARKNTVQEHFRLINSRDFSTFTYDCTCTRPNVFAYVYPSQPGKIFLCGAFWRAPATGTDSKAGTLVHESSHFTINGGTQDYAYGKTACMNLARTNPARAIMNADSHEYFAENTPPL